MASVDKFTNKSVVNQLRHIERTIAHPANTDIDTGRTCLNYSLAPDRGISSYEYFKQRKAELYCYGRDDVKVMAGWVITAPKDLPVEQYETFFELTYKFLAERYGENNCIESIVHRDESGYPHLHHYFIPVVPDRKHGGEKICANDVLNRKELRNFHPALDKHLREHGVNANIQTGITKAQGGNLTVWEMKEERNREYTREREQEQEWGRW